jgi:uncharacterized protein YjiS (DUF1127 family)
MRTDTFSDKEAAAPPDAPARGVLSVLKRCWHSFQGSRQRERLRACLYNMSERQLMDIGLTSGDIDYIVAYRAFKRLRDGTTLP